MKTIILPNELNLDFSNNLQIFDYNSFKEITKQQITLNQNAISFLIQGSKEVYFNNSTLSIENTEFLVMKSGHCLMTERLSEVNHYRSVLLFFSNEMVLKIAQKSELRKTTQSEYKSVYSFQYDAFIKRFVTSLLDILKLSKKTQEKMLEVKLEEIMLYLTDKFGTDFLYALIANSNDSTNKFTQTVESNKLNKLTLKELAFLCNMSVSSFKRQFEKQYAESPIKWFQNKRLEYAHYLINTEKKSSSEIYLEVGYENLSSFIQAYKMKYGVTPKQHQLK